MVIIHGTRKFLDRVGAPTVEPETNSTTILGSWFATVMFWKPQVALFVNENTLLPLLMLFAPAATVLDRFPTALAATLHAHGVAQPIIDHETSQVADAQLAKTNNRSVLGVMNEFVSLAEWRQDEVDGPEDLIELSVDLAEVPCGPLYSRHVSPDHELIAYLNNHSPTDIAHGDSTH